MMANLVADLGCNKGQLYNIVEAICRDFRQHDETESRSASRRAMLALGRKKL